MTEEKYPVPQADTCQVREPQAVAYATQVIDDEEEDCTYPIPYSEEKARQWALEDPDFHIETYRQDSYFNKVNQAHLREAMKSTKSVRQTKINGEWVFEDELCGAGCPAD